MDLVEKAHHDLASHFLNRYLEQNGDYAGIAVFDFYFVYRCLVRAKVAAIRSRERQSDTDGRADVAEARGYCDMACRQARKGARGLVIMSGLSGSGKSWLSERVMAELPAIRLRSDIERKRLFGLAAEDRSASGLTAGIYSADASDATYARLFELAAAVLRAGHDVILDAAFLESERRELAKRVAGDAGCHFVLLRVEASEKLLRDRVRARGESGASEAGVAVLEHQIDMQDEPAPNEQAIVFDNRNQPDVQPIIEQIRNRLHGPA
jgi:predicted kinase